MKRACYSGLLALAVVFSSGGAAWADSYGAIAYSQSTGAVGWSYGACSKQEAEDLALSYCDAEDAFIVTWSRNAYCALALGDDDGAYGAAWGSTREEAEERALEECENHTTNCYVKQWVFSGN